MSTAAIHSHRGDEYQVCIALRWLIRLLSKEDIEWVQVESMVLPTQNELVKVDDIVISKTDGSFLFIQAKINQTEHKSWSLNDKVLQEELVKAIEQLGRVIN